MDHETSIGAIESRNQQVLSGPVCNPDGYRSTLSARCPKVLNHAQARQADPFGPSKRRFVPQVQQSYAHVGADGIRYVFVNWLMHVQQYAFRHR